MGERGPQAVKDKIKERSEREFFILAKEYFDKKEKNMKAHNRFAWLKLHPEDQQIDEENMALRQHGFDDDGFRALMAAICLRACSDYQRVSRGKPLNNSEPIRMTELECLMFFDDEMMKYFTNGMDAEEVAADIRKMPDNQRINTIWRNMSR